MQHWERLLSGRADQLDARTGRWGDQRGVRYWAEVASGRLRAGRGLEACVSGARALRDLAAQRRFARAG